MTSPGVLSEKNRRPHLRRSKSPVTIGSRYPGECRLDSCTVSECAESSEHHTGRTTRVNISSGRSGGSRVERESGLAPEPSPWRAMLYIKLFPRHEASQAADPISPRYVEVLMRSYGVLEAPGGFEPPVFAALQTAPLASSGTAPYRHRMRHGGPNGI